MDLIQQIAHLIFYLTGGFFFLLFNIYGMYSAYRFFRDVVFSDVPSKPEEAKHYHWIGMYYIVLFFIFSMIYFLMKLSDIF